ncbi:MAG: hypothetical protein Q7U75_10070 [Desulfobacterales bacterium]|nr:hypothetical protein [Desulfobacterales bacterium]
MATATKKKSTKHRGPAKVATATETVPVTWPRDGLARADEAALFFRCSLSSIYRMMRADAFELVQVGKDQRITWTSIWNYVESGGKAV